MKKLIFMFIASIAIVACSDNKVNTNNANNDSISNDSINPTDTICDSLFYQE